MSVRVVTAEWGWWGVQLSPAGEVLRVEPLNRPRGAGRIQGWYCIKATDQADATRVAIREWKRRTPRAQRLGLAPKGVLPPGPVRAAKPAPKPKAQPKPKASPKIYPTRRGQVLAEVREVWLHCGTCAEFSRWLREAIEKEST